jgi:hypothetical protein
MPGPRAELRILRLRVPEVPEATAALVTEVVGRLRGLGLYKPPGPAETIDWARVARRARRGRRSVTDTAGREHALATARRGARCRVKDHEDLELVRSELGALLGG